MTFGRAAEAAAIYSHKAAALSFYSPLIRPEIRADIFLILQGRKATGKAIKAAKQAAALLSQYTHRAAQLTAYSAFNQATEATGKAALIGQAAAQSQRPEYRPDAAQYGLIRKAARIAATGTEAALIALYSAHRITRRDYEAAIKAAKISIFAAFFMRLEGRQIPQIPRQIIGRISAFMAAQAKTGTGHNTITGISRTGGLYRPEAAQDTRRRLITIDRPKVTDSAVLLLTGKAAQKGGFGIRSVPIKKAAYIGLNNIQSVAALLGSKTTPPILAAREAAIITEAGRHIRATEPEAQATD
jgi:hypothetical protein